MIENHRDFGVQPGDLWQVGRHRLACGYNSDPELVARLMDGWTPDLLFTDPPYCSGGMQDAKKKTGSYHLVGERADEFPLLLSDGLSARGYTVMMREMFRPLLHIAHPPGLYIFTDWRMWSTLEDVVSLIGYSLCNMLVWDKKDAPGSYFKAQHELIMLAGRNAALISGLNGQAKRTETVPANVLRHSRVPPGKKIHPTQKPLPLLREILSASFFAERIYDPFMGSGEMAIAAEDLGKEFRGMDASPLYLNNALNHLERQLMVEPEKIGNVR